MSEVNSDTPPATRRGRMDVFGGLDPEIRIRTKKMMMWFIIFAVVMLFAGITSAIIVMSGKVWIHITPPPAFTTSNIIIILSSLSLIGAVISLRKGNRTVSLGLTALTLVLGIIFTVSQYRGWKQLESRGMGYTIRVDELNREAYKWNALSKMTGEYGTDYWFEINGERVIREGEEYYRPSDPINPVTGQVMENFNSTGALLFILVFVHMAHLFFGLIYLGINTYRLAVGRLAPENWISLHTNGMYWHFMGILWLYLFAFVFYIF